jgi:hypothetical protein
VVRRIREHHALRSIPSSWVAGEEVMKTLSEGPEGFYKAH